MTYLVSRNVAKISKRWDYIDNRWVMWVTLRERLNQMCLSAVKVKPTDEYLGHYLHPCLDIMTKGKV